MSGRRVTETETAAYLEAWDGMAGYLHELASAGTDGRRPELIATLVGRVGEGLVTDEEVVSNLVLLAVAGHETTTNTLGMGRLALMRRPGELARLRADPALVPSAVEEILRFEAASHRNIRVATEDLELGGRRIRAGELVVLLLGAANRDPAEFPDPNRFDVARSPNRHLTFGHGPHFCLGAQLARVELQEALCALLRLDDLALVDAQPEWKENVRMRGLVRLLVRFRAAT
jgi:cytochrome P450